VTPSMTATRAIVIELTARIENERHKLYMDNLFSSPSDNLHTKFVAQRMVIENFLLCAQCCKDLGKEITP
jgi:hypothetical protein